MIEAAVYVIPSLGPVKITEEIERRFWCRADKNGPDHPTMPERGRCWIWIGHLDKDGYGKISLAGRLVRAHRLAHCIASGQIQAGLQVHHSCNRPACINPEHLSAGTNQQNVDYMVSLRRQAIGARRWNTKLTPADVINIRLRRAAGESSTNLAIEFGITDGTVNAALSRKSWKHVK